MTKRILIIMFICALAVSAVSAKDMSNTENKTSSYTLNLSFVHNAVNLIVGIFAGGYVLIKAALDIFHAVRNSSEDPNGLKKAIGSLILNIAVLGSFFFIINYVFGAMSPDSVNLSTATAQEAFFAALAGALTQL